MQLCSINHACCCICLGQLISRRCTPMQLMSMDAMLQQMHWYNCSHLACPALRAPNTVAALVMILLVKCMTSLVGSPLSCFDQIYGSCSIYGGLAAVTAYPKMSMMVRAHAILPVNLATHLSCKISRIRARPSSTAQAHPASANGSKLPLHLAQSRVLLRQDQSGCCSCDCACRLHHCLDSIGGEPPLQMWQPDGLPPQTHMNRAA